MLEKIQVKAIKNIFNLPKTTPSWGLLKECGLWPMRERILYKKFMIFQQIINTKSERLCKKVVENQKRMGYKNCWYSEIKEDADKYKVDIDEVAK